MHIEPYAMIKENKTFIMLKDVGMAHQKVCKQGSYDIKVKVNIL